MIRARRAFGLRWLALCSCGWGARFAGQLSAERAAAWHRDTGSEGCDHVMAVEYPKRLVRIIGDDTPEETRERLQKRGLTLVEVPADDPDHQASTRGKAEEE